MKQYLNDLNEALFFMSKKDRSKVIKQYKKKWKLLLKQGKDVDSIKHMMPDIKDIVKKYKNNHNTVIDKLNFLVKQFVNIIISIFQDIIDIIKTKKENKILMQYLLEIIVKLIIMLFIFELIKIPFIIIWHVLVILTNQLFYPFNDSLQLISKASISLIYLISCIAIFSWLFGNSHYKSTLILKWLVSLVIILPLIIITIFTYILILLSFFLCIKGINLIGFAVLLIGISLLFSYITDTIISIVYGKHKLSILPIVLIISFLVIGSLLTIDNLAQFSYSDNLNYSSIRKKNITKEYHFDNNMKLYIYGANYQFIINNDIDDNMIKVEGEYYPDLANLSINNYEIETEHGLEILLNNKNKTFENYINLYQTFITDLQNDQMYNYNTSTKGTLKIYANENIIRKLNKN